MNRSQPVAVGVIGVGNMGANHARVLNESSDAGLVGVADADAERAHTIAAEYNTSVLDTDTLLEAVDAVVVAVPTHGHFDVACRAIDAGCHILVEKPFVTDPKQGRELVRGAADAGVQLQVGHIERFNPAVAALFDLVDPTEIVAVRADRLGPPLGRSLEDDVVIDLMIHDIDIVLALMGSTPTEIAGMSNEDGRYASVLCRFNEGVVCTLTASRMTQRKVRRLEVTTREQLLVVDYLDQSLHIHRRSRPEYRQMNADVRYRHESVVERPIIESTEPLKRELDAFLSAVQTGDRPAVDGAAALESMRVVWHIQEQVAGARLEVSP